MLHIYEDASMLEKEDEMENPSQKPSLLSYFGAIVGVASLVMSLAYVVFVAGGQTNTINRHEEEIRELRQNRDNTATKEDVRRLESKIDQMIDRELRNK